jgi:demethylmenaquinone methyltransferase/2-methoxy-6-polyprenyl-1,4-benzoquinol methylase
MKKGIQKIFSEVAETYELVNHILTLGMDRRWRQKAALEASQANGSLWLDVCSGTGEMAECLWSLSGGKVRIVPVDFSPQMFARAGQKPQFRKLLLTQAEADKLPFLDETFDLVTISFATRNINVSREILIQTFKEFHRVLKFGSRFVNLETSQPRSKLFRKLFHSYVILAVKPVGFLISGSKAGYSYLSQTIPRFYDAEGLTGILQEAGFRRVTYKRLFFGVAAIHTGIKSPEGQI